MSTTISTNVPLVFMNLVVLEHLKSQFDETGLFYIISPWVKDVLFPLSEFGIEICNKDMQISTSKDIIKYLSERKVDVKVCTLDYFSEILSYKNPNFLKNPASITNQSIKNIQEIQVLIEFLKGGASIYLNKNFHSKIIFSSHGFYKGSFNFTQSGYYKNREDGNYTPKLPSTVDQYQQEYDDVNIEYFSEKNKFNINDMNALRIRHENIVRDTNTNWDKLMLRYINWEKNKSARAARRHGITI